MKKDTLSSMSSGWFIGQFEPSLHKTDQFEIAVKRYKAGNSEPAHFHKIATEYTLIVQGKVKINDTYYETNDIITIEPGEIAAFSAIEDTITTVVKIPSVLGDKYAA